MPQIQLIQIHDIIGKYPMKLEKLRLQNSNYITSYLA